MTAGIEWRLGSGDGTSGAPASPNDSLGGKMSPTRTQEVESTLTAVSGTSPREVFTDETQQTGFGIPDPPTSGDARSIFESSGAYTSPNDLIHYWRLTYDPLDESGGGVRGIDYATAGTPRNFGTFYTALASGNQITTQPQNAPDTMYVQRSSYPINGTTRGGSVNNATMGLGGDEVTIAAWVYPLSLTADGISGSGSIFVSTDQITSSAFSGVNFLHLGIADENDNNAGRILWVCRNSANTLEMRRLSSTALTTSSWFHLCCRFRLSTQEADIFIDGVKESSYTTSAFPASMTRTDPSTTDAGFGSVRNGDYRRFRGNIHSIAAWDVYLSDAAIAVVAAMGDGPELPAPPVIDHAGKWITFHTGANINAAREVVDFDDGTGQFTIGDNLGAGPLAADAAVSDTYRIWPANGFFSSIDNTQSVERVDVHRLVYMSNGTGGTLPTYRLWVNAIDPGPLTCEVAQGDIVGAEPVITVLADEEQTPDLGPTSNFNFTVDSIERFARPGNYPAAEFTSPLTVTQISTADFAPVWVRLAFRATEPLPLPHRCVFQINADSANGTTIGSMLVVIDVEGANEELVLGPDRLLRLAGGARVQAVARDATTGAAIPNRTVSISQTVGPGTLGPQSADVTDDTGNPVRATYLSPTDPADIGDTVTFRVEVN